MALKSRKGGRWFQNDLLISNERTIKPKRFFDS
jgi:hypothetical protein